MENGKQTYDWADYYKSAYEKEKKNNNRLAMKIAESEAREGDLSFALNRIQNNPLWKLSAPVRKGCHVLFTKEGKNRLREHIKHKTSFKTPSTESEILTETPAYLAYKEEVFRQKHSYLQLITNSIKEINSNSNPINTVNTGIYIDKWQELLLEDTDCHVFLFGHGYLDDTAKNKIKSYFNNNKSCLMAYADEDYCLAYEDYCLIDKNSKNNRFYPWFKPDWSPDTLLAFCYIGHVLIVRRSFFQDSIADGFPASNEESSADGLSSDDGMTASKNNEAGFYDLCLRAEEAVLRECGHDYREAAKRIGHIKEVLFHNLYEPDDKARRQIEEAANNGEDLLLAAEKCLREELEKDRDMTGAGKAGAEVRTAALKRRGIDAELCIGPDPDIYHIVYRPMGKVSVIIPSKDHPDVLEKCLSSFREKTAYTDYEWIVVDNGSSRENKEKMEKLQKEYGFLYLYEPMEFNFSAMCNLGAEKAQGGYLLFMNDDMEVIQKDWLSILLGQAIQPYVGAVGAKLWYAEGDRIQHAGITNLVIGPSHKLVTFPDDRNYYYGRNRVTYNVIGVTGACLMIARSKYREAGGMDESMKVAYNDVDLCFKLTEAGYYNVLRNDAVLYHYESLSRGLDEDDDGKWERLLIEKERLYGKHPLLQGKDPFYHEDLIDNASNYSCNFKFDFENHLKTLSIHTENTGKVAKARKNVLKLTVDHAVKQHRIHRDEPDIMLIMGWSYLPGEDNALYKRTVILRHQDGTMYGAYPSPWSRPDVEAILPAEKNVALAGFVVRIKKEELQSGDWEIGMLAESEDGRNRYMTWSDQKMHVDGR